MSRDDDDFMDDFIYSRGLMSKSARDRWNRQQLERNKAILAECESGLMSRVLARAARQNINTLDEGQQLDKPVREFINTMYALLNERGSKPPGDNMPHYDSAHAPYVSETQTRHAPMTGTHSHDHAAHGAPDHDDGIHGGDGAHSHDGDADHNHPDQHPHGPGSSTRLDKASAEEARAQAQEGLYGRELRGGIGPAERRRIQNARLRAHEENR